MKAIFKSFLLLSAFPATARLRRGRQLFLWLAVVLYVGGSVSAFSQGSLTPPPGGPAPTFKTLQQVEPRVDLQNAPASAVDTSNASYHFIINLPGSYYLSANLGATKANGIRINAAGVTLDLNGFEISRTSGSGGTGIEILDTAHRAVVRSGSIKGFATGIASLFGTNYARGCVFRDLAVSACSSGIFAGEGAVLESCRVHDNSGGTAIFAYTGSTLADCTVSNNSGGYGIEAGSGSTLNRCTVSGNTVSFGIYAHDGSTLTACNASLNKGSNSPSGGFFTGVGCTLTGCVASANASTIGTSSSQRGLGFSLSNGNTMHNCTATDNNGHGIMMGDKTTVVGCTVAGNKGHGIFGTTSAAIINCIVNGSGFGTGIAAGNGILVGHDSKVAGCNVQGNQFHGLQVGDKCTVSDSNINDNGSGTTGLGITAGNALTAIHCSVGSNIAGGISSSAGSSIRDCTLYKNTGTAAAVTVGDGSTVVGCTVRENNGDGIKFTTGCRIVENTCDFNGGNSITGAGLHGTGGGCRIEGNNLTGNFNYGITLDGGGNTVFKNSAHSNFTAAFNIAGGNDVGPWTTAGAATSPWANISY